MIDYRCGDVRDVMAEIPDGSVSLVASSPPFLALRSYLPADHESKHAEIGSEPDPATFLDTLLALTAEWGRVLAPWGSIAIELGDTYAGGAGAFKDAPQDEIAAGIHRVSNGTGSPIRNMDNKHQGGGPGWPRAKSLALIPQLYATSLAYGRNLLTGQPSPAGQWLVRNVIVWHRPNPAVGALGDKYRPSTSYITVATRSPKRWFDLTAVRTPHKYGENGGGGGGLATTSNDENVRRMPQRQMTHAGAPPLDCWFDQHDTWTLTTQPSRLAHYAMWPPKLAERLILSMCPAEVCWECGEPRRRIERVGYIASGSGNSGTRGKRDGREPEGNARGLNNAAPKLAVANQTLGWSDCGHDNYTPGVVLDPFCGTGSTLCVAELHGRDSIGIDINPANRLLLEPRMDEVKRALFGTQPEMPGQESLFDGSAA